VNRLDGRAHDALRPVSFERNYLRFPHGSVLCHCGDTRVLVTATVEEELPPWRKASGKGWVTAEYSMLPGATPQRARRERQTGGRSQEIQRVIGRALRAVCDFAALGPRTITLDCDVLQADGGTRTASITAAYVALHDAVEGLRARGLVNRPVVRQAVAATSVGIVEGAHLLDLTYAEDSSADVDLNVVRTSEGPYVEVQGTAEGRPFPRRDLDTLLDLADRGIDTLLALQKEALAAPPPPRVPKP
jgi:ribonuclease PH